MCVFFLDEVLTHSRVDAVELTFVGVGLVCVPVATLCYWRINERREREKGEVKYDVDELRRMGDRAPDFRYTL